MFRQRVESAFAEQGALSQAIAGFRARDPQKQMALAVTSAIEQGSALVVEAGTGTGKTFAYLVPALLSGKKVILSTGTKNLQEQLFFRDLPTVLKALKLPVETSLLKGRSNYLCLFRLQQHYGHAPSMEPALLNDLALIKKWSVETQSGDVGELTYIAEDSKALPLVTSTTDNCLGKDCPSFEDCHLLKARKKANKLI